MTVGPGGTPGTSLSRRSRRLVGIALMLPAFLLAALLIVPGAATAGEGGPDLTVTMTDAPDPVSAGQPVTFTILVSNTGTYDSTDTHLSFSTDGSAVTSARVTGIVGACNRAGTTASCDIGYLPTSSGTGTAIAPLLASNEAEVIIKVRAPEAPGSEFLSSASATSIGQSDEYPPDNTNITELTNISEFESRSGTVQPGGSLTTLSGPLNADDPFAVALKNVGTQALDVTIEEEPCGTQESDPLCSVPRVGGVAGDFIFETSGGGGGVTASTSTPPIVVARLYYDVSLLEGVKGFRIFYQKDDLPVRRLPRCDDGIITECFGKEIKANGDQIVRVNMKDDPRITRG